MQAPVPIPLTRALLLHTGGSFWLDVSGMQGSRDSHQFLRWLPGSPQIDLGMLSWALTALPLPDASLCRDLAHFVLSLSPRAEAPLGASGQLVAAAAVLWFCQAASHRLPLVRAGAQCPPEQPLAVLTGSGALVQRQIEHGVFRYEIDVVSDWAAKIRQLDRALAGRPVVAIHLLCPRQQVTEVRETFLGELAGHTQPHEDPCQLMYGDGVRLHLHPVSTLSDVAAVVANLLPTMPGVAMPGAGRSPAFAPAVHAAAHSSARAAAGDTASTAQARDQGASTPRGTLAALDTLNGRYQLLEVVGEGSVATVWRAYDVREQRAVAVKVLRPRWARDPARVDMFVRGVREMARLAHPGIVGVVQEHGHQAGHHYCVMEYMPGGTLHRAVLRGDMDPTVALGCVLDIGDALQHAHDHGLVHGDVEPQNMLFDGSGRARLAGFGLARPVEARLPAAALAGRVFGAPGLAGCRRVVGERADFLALAMTALFVLYGRNLPPSLLRQPRALLAGLSCPAAVKEVIARAIDSAPDRREHRMVATFCAELRAALGPSRRGKTYLLPTAYARRRGRLALWAQGVTLALTTMSAVLLWQTAGERHAAESLLMAGAECKRAPTSEAFTLDVSDEGRRLVSCDAAGVRVWTGDNAPEELPGGPCVAVAFSRQGWLAVARRDRLELWDLTGTFAQVRHSVKLPWRPESLAFSPDGRSLRIYRDRSAMAREPDAGAAR